MCDCCKGSNQAVASKVLAELVAASKKYRVRHVQTGRYLVGDVERTERPLSNGLVRFTWVVDAPRLGGDWVREDALAIAKMWTAVMGDMSVEIEEVGP